MANKRIKDLSTTAAVTASDDFIAVDGATNGTRKLDAYSPTFGGNLTVSGTGNSSVAGTLLVATTTNSGNGKLQLATHTTSAGGIGFGTDTSLFRTAAGEVGLDALSGTATVFGLRIAGTRKSYLYWENGTSTLTLAAEPASSSLKFLSANALALTLDSSQNATFAGKVTANGAQANYTINALGFIESQGTTNSKGFRIYNTANGEAVNFQSNGITQTYDGTFDISSSNTTGLRIYGNAGSPLWRWVPWNGGSSGIVTNDSSGYINTSTSLPLLPITAPAAPASGWLLYTDSADSNKLKAKASTGTVVTLGTP